MTSSRNPFYQFISTDTNATEALVTAVFEGLLKTTVRPSSPEWLLIKWV